LYRKKLFIVYTRNLFASIANVLFKLKRVWIVSRCMLPFSRCMLPLMLTAILPSKRVWLVSKYQCYHRCYQRFYPPHPSGLGISTIAAMHNPIGTTIPSTTIPSRQACQEKKRLVSLYALVRLNPLPSILPSILPSFLPSSQAC
jgi:hypothetical protein